MPSLPGELAARLGLSRAQTLRRVTLPLLRTPIAGGALLVGLHALAEFGALQNEARADAAYPLSTPRPGWSSVTPQCRFLASFLGVWPWRPWSLSTCS